MAQNFHIARRQVGVTHDLGLHLRVADQFVRSAKAFQSEVRVHFKGAMADGKSILGLMGLGAECGAMLIVEAEGCDAEDAVDALARLISSPPPHGEDHDQPEDHDGAEMQRSEAPTWGGGSSEASCR